MKRLVLTALLAAFLMGCANMQRSEFLEHDTMYASASHAGFSWFGYHHPTAQDLRKSNQQDWWGIDIPYVPGR